MKLLVSTPYDLMKVVQGGLDSVDGQITTFITIGTTLCGIMMMINLIVRYKKNVLGDTADLDLFSALWYPFVISVMLTCYTPIVNGFDDLATNSVGNLLANPFLDNLQVRHDNAEKSIKDQEEALAKVNQPTAEKANKGSTKFGQGEIKTIDKAQQDIGETASDKEPSGFIEGAIWRAWQSFLKLIVWLVGTICCLALYVVYKVNFLFLKILGPISIGISVIPEYRQSAPNFFYKLFTYTMYPIMGNVILQIAGNLIDSLPPSGAGMSVSLLVFVIVFVIIAFTQIPKAAANIITLGSGVGSSKAGSMAQNSATRIATKAVTKM